MILTVGPWGRGFRPSPLRCLKYSAPRGRWGTERTREGHGKVTMVMSRRVTIMTEGHCSNERAGSSCERLLEICKCETRGTAENIYSETTYSDSGKWCKPDSSTTNTGGHPGHDTTAVPIHRHPASHNGLHRASAGLGTSRPHLVHASVPESPTAVMTPR